MMKVKIIIITVLIALSATVLKPNCVMADENVGPTDYDLLVAEALDSIEATDSDSIEAGAAQRMEQTVEAREIILEDYLEEELEEDFEGDFEEDLSGSVLMDEDVDEHQNFEKETGPPEKYMVMKKENQVEIDILDLKNTDILDALRMIAKKSGFNIVAGRDVRGKVSIYLRDVNVEDALRIILDSHKLTYAVEDGIIRVMTSKDFQLKYGYKFGEELETSVIQLVFTDALEINSLLNQMKSVIGKVIADKSSNSIVLKDTPQHIKMMEKIIKKIDIPRMSHVFELRYAKAEDLSDKVSELITKNVGKVEVDSRSNKIIVTDIPEKIFRIERLINALDERDKEVLIEAKIVQVVLSDSYQMGIDWQAIVSGFHNLTLQSDFDILESSDKRGKVSIGTLADDNYEGFIEVLDEIGTTNILSNPRITVINNKEAKILVGSTEPYITSTTTTPSSGPTTTAETVNFIEVGVKLYVTPTIHRDNFVTMKIKPEVSSVLRSISTSSNNSIPVVETSEAETTVMVKDGATIVIGGLMKDENIKTEKRIPLLGDIPFIGRVFSSVDDLVRKTELMIFLTPNIVSGEEHMGYYRPDLDSERNYGF